MEKRIFYNIDNGQLNIFNTSHVIYWNKNFKGKIPFDGLLRGIIKDDILYLRVFYPFDDISELSFNDLMKKSLLLLSEFKGNILEELKKQNIKIDNVKLNVTNTDLKSFLNTQYV